MESKKLVQKSNQETNNGEDNLKTYNPLEETDEEVKVMNNEGP